MTRVGLVLGAGGVVGQAYHAGVLAALEHDLRWDPRSAGIIVGTSAGSITASLLRGGVRAGDLGRLDGSGAFVR
jgi:NTE family protein